MIVSKQYKDNFVQVDRFLIQDENLSLQAKGLASYLLSLPKSWNVNLALVAKKLNISKASLYKYLKELINNGYLQKINFRDEKGYLTKESLYIFENAKQNDTFKEKDFTNLQKELLDEKDVYDDKQDLKVEFQPQNEAENELDEEENESFENTDNSSLEPKSKFSHCENLNTYKYKKNSIKTKKEKRCKL